MNKRWLAPVSVCGLLLLIGCGSAEVGAVPSTPITAGPETTVAEGGVLPSTPATTGPKITVQAQVKASPSSAAQKAVNGPDSEHVKEPPANVPPPGQAHRPPLTGLEKAFVQRTGDEVVDPAAVLEAGTEACSRLEFLQKIDPAVALGSVVSGEVPDAALAIKYLCPNFAGLSLKAGGGFPDGEYAVGRTAVPEESIISGRYTTVSASPECSWQIYNKQGKMISSGEASESEATITVGPQASQFHSGGCYAWVPAK